MHQIILPCLKWLECSLHWPCLLQTLVEKRNIAIQHMVEEATRTSGKGGSDKKQLRPLHTMDFQNEGLQEIDLSENAVLVWESSQHHQNGLAAVPSSGGGAYP